MAKFRNLGSTSIGALSVATCAVVAPMQAFAQDVSDRTLSDVKVERVGTCSTVTVNFNIRVQVLSHFPEISGRELHIRISPLDASTAGTLRESLRPPGSVPSLRSIEYEGDNPAGPILSLFFTEDMRFEVEAGRNPQSVIVKLDEPGAGEICSGSVAAVSAAGVPERPALPDIPIPKGLYVVNLISRTDALGELNAEQEAAIAGRIAYETAFERNAEEWHRLRIGFYETREEADKVSDEMRPVFGDTWVTKVSADERAQGVVHRLDTGVGADVSEIPAPTFANAAEIAETAQLIGEAEDAIAAGNNDQAIQLLTKALNRPENENTRRALELLGLTRERKGQVAHARAEYQEYLRRYLTGEGVERVRQRLAALDGGMGPTESPGLRQASGTAKSAADWTWGARGSFSQYYFRDQSTTKFIDASKPDNDPDVDSSVNLNRLLTSGDISISGGNDRRQLEFRAAGSYARDFRPKQERIDPETGETVLERDHIKTVTSLYLDYAENSVDMSLRVGRQTKNSAGVLGRFDGALLGWQATPKVRINAVGGFPVLTSRQTHILRKRYFFGGSVDIGAKRSPVQTTFYYFDQRAKGGFTDRRSVGVEARVLKPRFNAYSIIDYDLKFKKLNLGLVTLNYSFPDNSNLSLIADYRQSPLLTANNALIGQFDPITMLPIRDLRGLEPFYPKSEIYQLAEDRTLVAKSATLTYSRPITRKLQANLDFTVTDTGGMPESGGVPAVPASGTEFYYGAQLVGTGLLWNSDIYMLSGRFADTDRSRTYRADFNARVPITSKFRLSPRLRYGYRKDKDGTGNFSQFQPTMRMNFYPFRRGEIELEAGGNFSTRKSTIGGTTTRTKESGFVLTAGYRLDF